MTNLQEAVIEQLGGKESLKDVAEHGASGGYPGFTYYKDTCEFYDKHEAEIWEKLNEEAEGQGITAIQLVAMFGDADSVNSADTFKNMLAWFALETVAREVTEA